MRIQIALIAVVTCITWGSCAFAQKEDSAPEILRFRKWDLGGGVGIVRTDTNDFMVSRTSRSYDQPLSLAWNIDTGRYVTRHLKVEAGVMGSSRRSFWDDVRGDGVYTSGTVRPTSLSGAVTYQFFENVFA